ncbi:MAG: hypothetical protein R2875_08210 [Desulfobacterales bacterium]
MRLAFGTFFAISTLLPAFALNGTKTFKKELKSNDSSCVGNIRQPVKKAMLKIFKIDDEIQGTKISNRNRQSFPN